MSTKNTIAFGLTIILMLGLTACKSGTTTPTTPTATIPVGQAIINSDSIVTATIQGMLKQADGYPWILDILIQTSTDVGNLPNPTIDSIGKAITVQTDEDMTAYKTGDIITAKVKYSGDVNIPGGIRLYMYNIAMQQHP